MTHVLTTDETMAVARVNPRGFAIPTTLNLAIAAGVVATHIYLLILLPLFLLSQSWWWGLTILPFCLLHSTQWGLIHEAIHKQLHPDAKLNQYGGRLLSILMGVSFHVLNYGHLMHHQMNRDWESEIVTKRGWRSTTMYYVTLMGGLYLKEIIGGLLLALFPGNFILPEKGRFFIADHGARQACRRYFFERGNVWPLRVDIALATVLYIGAFWLYSAAWWMLAAFLFSRALMISFMDNIYHYGTAHDVAGKNLALAAPWSQLLLHSNYHQVHHTNPLVPWTELPRIHTTKAEPFDGDFAAHGWMQFRGPILAA